jgi:hypothetical protein
MLPYITILKGLLSLETVSIFMIVGALSMEVLASLNKNTTFKSSTRYLIVYDLIYLVSISIGYIFLNDRQFIFTIMVMSIPYWPLVNNNNNKYKALIGERYPRWFVEKLSTRVSILRTRTSLIAMGAAALISALTHVPKYVVPVFIVLSTIQSAWSLYAYRKYYVVFDR